MVLIKKAIKEETKTDNDDAEDKNSNDDTISTSITTVTTTTTTTEEESAAASKTQTTMPVVSIEAKDDDEKDPNNNNINNNNNNNNKILVSKISNNNNNKRTTRKSKTKRRLLMILTKLIIHLLCISLYVIPIIKNTDFSEESSKPVLDELHILTRENKDINGESTTIKEIFTNDYWGRPMNSPSSHKSWRPLTVLSFRYLKLSGEVVSSESSSIDLFFHRFINILLHALIADIVAILSLMLFSSRSNHNNNNTNNTSSSRNFIQYIMVKIIFILHPTHVEVTANCANRSHLLAILFSVLLCDFRVSNLIIVSIYTICGLLCSETFIFQVPAILVTLTTISYKKNYYNNYYYYVQKKLQQQQQEQQEQNNKIVVATKTATAEQVSTEEPEQQPSIIINNTSSSSSMVITIFIKTMKQLLVRYIIIVTLTISYYIFRKKMDWISIPDGLIRPAENPFYEFTGFNRFLNYSYILSIHILKSITLDIIGFSHEYGYRCIQEITTIYDKRLLIPLLILVIIPLFITIKIGLILYYKYIMMIMTSVSSRKQHKQQRLHHLVEDGIDFYNFLLWLVYLSWGYITLFPISGIVKVGTFIADRIVIPSSIVYAMFVGRFVTTTIIMDTTTKEDTTTKTTTNDNNNDNETNNNNSNSKSNNNNNNNTKRKIRRGRSKRIQKYCIVIIFIIYLIYMYKKVHGRIIEWMDSLYLMESSLKTCPNSAKSNLEISKIYSGLYPQMFNLTKSRYYLNRVLEIDSSYCDVHQQISHVAIQENKYIEFEEHLVEAILCPYTMGGSQELWQRYWNVVLHASGQGDNNNDNANSLSEARIRYNKYIKIINDAIEKEKQQQEKKRKATTITSNNNDKRSKETYMRVVVQY